MHDTSPVLGILTVLSASLIGATICLKLRQSVILGYIVGGVLVGPHGLGLVPKASVETIAEIGIFLLLFSIGLELSLQKLSRVKTIAIGGGTLFSILGILAVSLVGWKLGWSLIACFTVGAVFAISNTSVVLRLLSERGEIGSTHGNITTGILIFQDVLAVPLLALIPILSERGSFKFVFVTQLIGQVMLYVVVLYGLARFFVPVVLNQIAKTRSKELFSIAVLAICAAIAASAQSLGLSLGLGAFIAGIIISESDFSNQASTEILPMKDAFGSIFFASVGMLLDPMAIASFWQWLPLSLMAIVGAKFLLCFITIFGFRYPIKSNVFTSLALAQIGEFSLLILIVALQAGIISQSEYQFFLANAILSIFLTPYLLKLARPLSSRLQWMERIPWLARGLSRERPSFVPFQAKEGVANLDGSRSSGHVVLCGYGPTGSIVMKKLLGAGLPVVVVDLNYRIIQTLKSENLAAIYGDCSSSHVLEAAGIDNALLLIVTIPDPAAMRAIVKAVRHRLPELPIYVRVKYNSDRERILDLGASEVVWEEFEAGERLAKISLNHLRIGAEPVTEAV